jgi:DNA-binding SARP family transcriptional activator
MRCVAGRDDTMEFRILGPFEVSEHGQPLEVGAGKQRALLAVLLLRAGEVVSTDHLIDALWDERPPASALNSVHSCSRSVSCWPYEQTAELTANHEALS